MSTIPGEVQTTRLTGYSSAWAGRLWYDAGDHKKAEPLYQQALEIRRQVLGEKHPDFAQSLNNLASLYYAQRLYAKAEPLYRQALEICRKELGEKHPDLVITLNNLALLYCDQRLYAKAEPLYAKAEPLYQ